MGSGNAFIACWLFTAGDSCLVYETVETKTLKYQTWRNQTLRYCYVNMKDDKNGVIKPTC
jgi:hypothetical protein